VNLRLALAAAALLLPVVALAATFKLTWLAPADDPRLERARIERGALGHPGGPAVDALKVALSEGRLELDTAGAKLELDVVEVADAAAARAAAAKAEKGGAAALITDLPAAWTLAAADAVKLPVLNAGATSDALRQADCRRNLFHLGPSERMRADALAQTLVARRWSQVLLLTGPAEADRERSATAQAAIKRYGLKLVASKPFKLSADPRERDLANPLLLTQGAYDVVWVVDSDGEFAAHLPYRTALPRPVVGDGGLVAVAWSPKFERFGAPQVTRRLAKAVGRPMGAHDWPAWLAGKALVGAAVAAPKGPLATFHKALAEAELDGSKGVAMSFRPWDGQLRQPLLLSDGQSVVAVAPDEGVLHPKNRLDTLGADAPEKLCKGRP
jgi:ABC transporter substrate binding protein (PQQ-dependent alcohol dehydrogenase system)